MAVQRKMCKLLIKCMHHDTQNLIIIFDAVLKQSHICVQTTDKTYFRQPFKKLQIITQEAHFV